MLEPKEILIDGIKMTISEGMTYSKLADLSGVDNSIISRFLSGKTEDIRSKDFFRLVHALPKHIREATLAKLGMVNFDLAAIAASSPPEEKARVLEAIAHSLTVQNKEKAKAVA